MAKPKFLLTGPKDGPPTVEDLVALFRQLTGRDPSPGEIEQVREKSDAKLNGE